MARRDQESAPAAPNAVPGAGATHGPAQAKANALVEEFLVAVAEDAKHAPPPLPPPAHGLLKVVMAAGLLAGCAGVWLIAVYAPAKAGRQPVACVDQRLAVLRLRLVQQAKSVNAYIERNGRLPPNLLATGDSLVGVTFLPRHGDQYELAARDRDLLASYQSSKPSDEFLGDAVSVLSRPCR
jgi:hypothetical protein